MSNNYKYQNTYGGEIFKSDFNCEYSGSRNIASRIFKDWAFDNSCKKNAGKYQRRN